MDTAPPVFSSTKAAISAPHRSCRRRTYQLTEEGLARYRRELERLRRCVADGESEEPGEEEAP